MPAIIDVAQQLCADGLPVLLVDTCILLDVIRAPIPAGKIHGIQSAVELSELRTQAQCHVVASSLIQSECNHNVAKVVKLLEQHLAACEQNALAFQEACGHVHVSLPFAKPEFQAAGLPAKLRDQANALLRNAIHLEPTDESGKRAMNRCLANARPSQKGYGPKDCTVIEEYLELCRLLRASGFAKKLVFCSSNTNDYEKGKKLDQSLASEFATIGLVYTNVLYWAVNELKTV